MNARRRRKTFLDSRVYVIPYTRQIGPFSTKGIFTERAHLARGRQGTSNLVQYSYQPTVGILFLTLPTTVLRIVHIGTFNLTSITHPSSFFPAAMCLQNLVAAFKHQRLPRSIDASPSCGPRIHRNSFLLKRKEDNHAGLAWVALSIYRVHYGT